ncbi:MULTISPECIES: LacI family DNA-binding transcriptional regulator [unclassified Streptomyces]|uniref:LacI family DNA-binding transcriptional regulator n=1 Tax=unclassified Streptomyces TaxID=2593676 RepID=UPI0033B8CCFD
MAGAPLTTAPPTTKQVATLAEGSAMTVSRVLRGDTGVSAYRRARVEAAVRQLGYRPNALARNFRHGQGTGTIGLIVTNLANPLRPARARHRGDGRRGGTAGGDHQHGR